MKKNIKTIMKVLAGGITGAIVSSATIANILNKKIITKNKGIEKIGSYYHIFNQWLCIRQSGRTVAEYFKENGYATVAIYGMKEFGERLYEELSDAGISVKYAIDKNAKYIFTDIDVVEPSDELEPVDVIIVTATFYFNEIEDMLSEKVECPIVSLEDIIYKL